MSVHKPYYVICRLSSWQSGMEDNWAIVIGPGLVIILLKRGCLIHFATIQISSQSFVGLHDNTFSF
jgi:hypothetical protein